MEELRREREQAEGAEKAMASQPVPVRANRIDQVATPAGGWGNVAG